MLRAHLVTEPAVTPPGDGRGNRHKSRRMPSFRLGTAVSRSATLLEKSVVTRGSRSRSEWGIYRANVLAASELKLQLELEKRFMESVVI